MSLKKVFYYASLSVAMLVLTSKISAQDDLEEFPVDSKTGLHYDPSKLIVTFQKKNIPKSIGKSASSQEVQTGIELMDEVFQKYRVTKMTAFETVNNSFVLECTNCDIAALQNSLQDKFGTSVVAEPYTVYELLACPLPVQTTNDYFPNIGMLDQISARCAWNLSYGRNSTIGLIDATGAGPKLDHQDIDPKIISSTNLSGTSFKRHGLWMAGLMAATANNGFGIPGVARSANLRIYNAAVSETSLSTVRAIDGVNKAVADKVDVINLSFIFASTGAMRTAVLNAISKGIPVVTGSGNKTTSFNDGCNIPGIICVTSVDQNDNHEATGNKSGSSVSISAPDRGSGMRWLAAPNTVASLFGGTSSSSAIVSGVVALMHEVNSNMQPFQVKQYLECSSDDISNVNNNGTKYKGLIGKGRLNAYGAVQQALMYPSGVSGPVSIGRNGNYSYSLPSYPGASYSWSVQGTGLTISGSNTSRYLQVSTNSSYSGGRLNCVIRAGRCSQSKAYTLSGPTGLVGSYTDVYPNPTSGDLNVSITQEDDLGTQNMTESTDNPIQYKYILFDSYAKQVIEKVGGSSVVLSTSGLPKGLYTLKIIAHNSASSQQVVIN